MKVFYHMILSINIKFIRDHGLHDLPLHDLHHLPRKRSGEELEKGRELEGERKGASAIPESCRLASPSTRMR